MMVYGQFEKISDINIDLFFFDPSFYRSELSVLGSFLLVQIIIKIMMVHDWIFNPECQFLTNHLP